MNMKNWLILIKCLIVIAAQSQTVVRGTVYDASTKEALPGAVVYSNVNNGTSTNINGEYELKVFNDATMTYEFVGYQKAVKPLTLNGDTVIIDVYLKSEKYTLNEVTVSANRFEQRIEDLTISVDVLDPDLLTAGGATDIEAAADKNPGVYMADGQANIRGGSGFSYGAGSRVMVLVDGLPILTADAGDVKWDALPIENIEQVEVIKGAASALYGSSALNGVINVTTGFALDTSETTLRTYYAVYDDPDSLDAKWWDKAPVVKGVHLNHAQKVKKFDLVFGGAAYEDQGYIQGADEQRYRGNFKVRYNFPNKDLKVGVNGSGMKTTGGQAIIWNNADSGFYQPLNGEISFFDNDRLYVDPYISYVTPNGTAHDLKSRVYFTENRNSQNQGSKARSIFNQYQYQRVFFEDLVVTAGAVYTDNLVKSELYGDHTSLNMAVFAQGDYKWKKWNISGGIRQEGFSTDGEAMEWKPNFRYGMNYQLAKATFVRGSYGQGFRQPSIGEKFINTSIPGLFFIPNPGLQSETGWSAELGLKQGFQIKKWKGYVDVAAFMNRYNNMVEFRQDSIIINDLFAGDILLGFRASNVESAEIKGIETTFMGEGMINKVHLQIFGGYTYMNPIDLTIDQNDTAFQSGDELLKYRFKHLFKTSIQLKYKQVSLGGSYRYNSYIRNIDRIFEEQVVGIYVIPGVAQFRTEKTRGDHVVDLNIGYTYKVHQLSLIAKNALNETYTQRPANAQPPRTWMLQYQLKF